MQRFWQKKSEEKNFSTKVEAWLQLLLMKVYSSVTKLQTTDARRRDAMAFTVAPIT